MSKQVKKLLNNHQQLIHTEMLTVKSHIQREQEDWFLNTIMLDNIDVPFKYKRKQPYKTLTGKKVNVTYYPDTENIAGLEFEIMKVVRIKVS